ncbi:hypothetical protein DS2_16859 [Catenovulum agarivorans DS-2]|uniref:Uncharacterized protein n=1 Tax=Catenovulum agarivorans DS-2 TaxID=1328313 RepID=W7Q9C8_9ALTE|nr:hypothetical protein [Catenovulum agarivorans]EWH08566.1 hypothetical protein DS2_16859 [Catenovulum agarivorans DS-2]
MPKPNNSTKTTQIGQMTAKQKLINGLGAVVICIGAVIVMNVLDDETAQLDKAVETQSTADNQVKPTETSLLTDGDKPQATPQIKAMPSAEPVESLPTQQALDEKQAEIEALVQQLDENLANEEEKARLESLINEKLHEYNQLILPEALKQMGASE